MQALRFLVSKVMDQETPLSNSNPDTIVAYVSKNDLTDHPGHQDQIIDNAQQKLLLSDLSSVVQTSDEEFSW